MVEDIERKAFEKWFRSYICDHDFDLRRDTLGIYKEQRSAFAWRAWQAARAQQQSEEFTLLNVIADIRKKTGVGDKPMLSELADVLAAKCNNQPALSEKVIAKIIKCIDDAIKEDESAGNPHLCSYGEIAYRALQAVNALPVQPNTLAPKVIGESREALGQWLHDMMVYYMDTQSQNLNDASMNTAQNLIEISAIPQHILAKLTTEWKGIQGELDKLANAPKVTREELEDMLGVAVIEAILCVSRNTTVEDQSIIAGKAAADAILARWPHIVGE